MSVIDETRMPLVVKPSPVQSAQGARIDKFIMQGQCHSNWCWAAVAASVASFYKTPQVVDQRAIAGVELKEPDCLRHGCGTNVDFNVTNVLASSLNRLGCLRELARNERASPEEVFEELQGGRPLCVRTVWRRGGAHFVVIAGYQPAAKGNGTLDLHDPFWGPSQYSYDQFADHYQLLGGRWMDTYYTKPSGPKVTTGSAEDASDAYCR
jgi:hypothetical protein